MDDLISRQAAVDAINTWDKFGVDERNRVVKWHEGLEPYIHLRDVVTAIINLPSAQPEIIRCWECKWYKHDSDCYGDCTREGYDERWYTVYTTDFCSMAVRKDNETES